MYTNVMRPYAIHFLPCCQLHNGSRPSARLQDLHRLDSAAMAATGHRSERPMCMCTCTLQVHIPRKNISTFLLAYYVILQYIFGHIYKLEPTSSLLQDFVRLYKFSSQRVLICNCSQAELCLILVESIDLSLGKPSRTRSDTLSLHPGSQGEKM